MKATYYLLPISIAYSGCALQNTPHSPSRENLEIIFSENSWSLTWEQMKELKRFRSGLDSSMTVSLEVCAANPQSEYFPRNRAQGIKNFLRSGNPIDVELSICHSPDKNRYRNVFVSVADTL